MSEQQLKDMTSFSERVTRHMARHERQRIAEGMEATARRYRFTKQEEKAEALEDYAKELRRQE